MGFTELINDPVGYLISLLPLIPAILPALILHEVAHGYAAFRLGDPTAKLMGRLSLNPLRHLDPLGTLSMFLIGLGWAKPVPVNPRYFKNPRRDDFLVSIAGITANLMMSIVGCVLMYALVAFSLNSIPAEMWLNADEYLVEVNETLYRVSYTDTYFMAPGMGEYLVQPYLGRVWGFVYEVVVNFAVINVCLAVFNLLPVPPLDGYHVVNDLLLKKSLFAPEKIMRMGQALLLILMFTGWLDKGLNWAVSGLFDAVGHLALAIAGH